MLDSRSLDSSPSLASSGIMATSSAACAGGHGKNLQADVEGVEEPEPQPSPGPSPRSPPCPRPSLQRNRKRSRIWKTLPEPPAGAVEDQAQEEYKSDGDGIGPQAPWMSGEGLLPGPVSQHEACHWAASDIQRIFESGPALLKVDCKEKLKKCFTDSIIMRTDYSGAGTAEEALRHLELAAMGEASRSCTSQRACDKNPACRQILQAHDSSLAPACVHSDILDRMPASVKRRVRALRQKFLLKATSAMRKGMRKMTANKKFGEAFLRASFKIANTAMQKAGTDKLVARCDKHRVKKKNQKKLCPVLPPVPEEFAGWLCNVSGVCCFDFSQIGKRMGWLGESTLAFVQWLSERVIAGEDFTIVECVEQFTDDLLAELLKGKMDCVCLRITPTLFGDPILRPRKYMVLSKAGEVAWEPAIVEKGHQAVFNELFARKTFMEGIEKLRPPPGSCERAPVKARRKAEHAAQAKWKGVVGLASVVTGAERDAGAA